MNTNATLVHSDPAPSGHRKGYRIIQVHPTLNCNLKCSHCYSSSAPGLKTKLNIDDLHYFLSSAYDRGYNTIAVSGGEPFLYPELKELLRRSKETGYYTSLTTNGGLLPHKNNRDTLEFVDLVAVSIDGVKEEHNAIRGNLKAFDQALEAVEILKEFRKRFGFIHLLHNEPLDTLAWLCEFTLSHGAGLLQLHPFESAGRGRDASHMQLSVEQTFRFFILYHYFRQKHENDFLLQLDVLHRQTLLDQPETVYFFKDRELPAEEYLRELIIDEHGYILPGSHGFNREFALGNINERRPLAELLTVYSKEKLEDLKQLYEDAYYEMLADEDVELFNYAERIIQHSWLVKVKSQSQNSKVKIQK